MAKKQQHKRMKQLPEELRTPKEAYTLAIAAMEKMRATGKVTGLDNAEVSALIGAVTAACSISADMTPDEMGEGFRRLNVLYETVRSERERILIALASV